MDHPLTESVPTGETLRDQLRRELAPSGLLQAVLVEQIARGIDRLNRAAALENHDDPANSAWLRYQAQAERTFYRALAEFRRLAKAGLVVPKKVEAQAVAVPTPPAPAALAPSSPYVPGEWRSRVDRGPSGDLRWPVITGTPVKVDDVMSLLGEGWSEAELLARYPVIGPGDLAACRDCDARGGAGPVDGSDEWPLDRNSAPRSYPR